MRIIGLLILSLELLTLIISLQSECKRNDITLEKAKAKLKSVLAKLKRARVKQERTQPKSTNSAKLITWRRS